MNHHFTQNKNKNKNKINNVYNNTNFRGGIDQGQNSEEIPIYDKDNDSNTLSFLLWNCRSLIYEKRSFINSRSEDVIILNEIWENNSNVSGYILSTNVRKNQRGGGVSILVRDDFEMKTLDDSIKDTLVTKILLDRSRYLLIITSYFPRASNAIIWDKRWEEVINLIERNCPSKDNMNIIIAGDFNKDISKDTDIQEQLKLLKLKIVNNPCDITYEMNGRSSKIDHFIISDHLQADDIQTHRSMSDHRLLTMKIRNVGEVPRRCIEVTNRKLAKEITLRSLKKSEEVREFMRKHREDCKRNKRKLKKKVRRDTRYKEQLSKLITDADYSVELIKRELSIRWKNLWKETERMRFGLNPKEAFKRIRTITKYGNYEKRDGSIITKVKVGNQIVQDPKTVNSILKDSLQDLCGNPNASTLTKSLEFPHLPELSIQELREIVKRLSRNKALADDYCEDTAIWDKIMDDDKTALMFTSLWDKDVTNSKEFERHLTGRLIPLNKVHPEIPKPEEMRPVIALSTILKLVESRFRSKLEDYMAEQMIPCQVGFVRNCGTHVNIIRIIKRCLGRYGGIRNKKGKFRPKALLFIDFKSAYNNVNLDMLFSTLLSKRILNDDEITFLRTLYSKTTLTVGNGKIEIHKGVMQGSIISPALFNIFIEPLLRELNKIANIEDIFAYADDIAVCTYSINELRRIIHVLNEWSTKAGIPINLKKSSILNIRKNDKTTKIVSGNVFLGYPIVEKYKYLGVWIDEKLDPETHVKLYRPKVRYLVNRFRLLPKRSITPRFLIDLWTLVIRPVFDYAFCLAKMKNKTSERRYLTEELKSVKALMGLRTTTSSELVKNLIGYDPDKLCSEIIRRAINKWTKRKGGTLDEPNVRTDYRRKTSNILLTWSMIWCNNLLFTRCKQHNEVITLTHIQNLHGGRRLMSLSNMLQEGHKIHKKIEQGAQKRKGRIIKIIESRVSSQDSLARKIIDSIDQN